jgi:hypothetical protein
MPCPFTGPKMFWAGPNVFVPNQKFIYILWQSQTFCARQKDDLHSVKSVFCAGTKAFEEALNEVKFLGWFKKFGLAQNILRPEKGQGITILFGTSIHQFIFTNPRIIFLTKLGVIIILMML